VRWNEGVSFPIQSGHGCIGCSEDGFWDKGSFYERLTDINDFSIEANADAVGGTAAAVVGVGIAAHAGLTALNRSKKADANQSGADQQ
jgi:hydrogenase small subunit